MKKKAVAIIILFVMSIILMTYSLADSSGGAPEAASFKSGGSGEPGYTGGLSTSFPLMNVPGRGMSYPITLSYSASNRLDEEASWVGFGFDLGAGVIMRSVRGIPDSYVQSGTSGGGYLNENSCYNGCYSEEKFCDCSDQDYYSLSFPGGGGRLFSTSSASNTWTVENWNNYKISTERAVIGATNDVDKWTVTTSDGTRYIFSQKVMRHLSSPDLKVYRCQVSDGAFSLDTGQSTTRNKEATDYVYAWYLTMILSPDYVDVAGSTSGPDNTDKGSWVLINYSTLPAYGYEFPNTQSGMLPTSAQYAGPADTYDSQFQGIKERPGANADVLIFYSKFVAVYSEAYISSIETPTHVALFDASADRVDRKDNTGTSHTLRLKNIVLKNRNDDTTVQSKVVFNNAPGLATDVAKGADGDYTKGRLTLLGFTQYGKNNEVSTPETKFTYYNGATQKYYRFAADWYGFYNGISPTQETLSCRQYFGDDVNCQKWGYNPTTKMFTLKNDGYNVQGICSMIASQGGGVYDFANLLLPDAGDDEHDFCISGSQTDSRSVAWVLKTVTYPTGGTITYDYECNTYDYDTYQTTNLMTTYGTLPGAYLKKGGLRVKTITTDDGLGHTLATQYQYPIGGATLDQSSWTLSQGYMPIEMKTSSYYVEYPSISKSIPGYGKATTEFYTVKSGSGYQDRLKTNWGTDWCKPAIMLSNGMKRGIPYHSAVYKESDLVTPISESTNSLYSFPDKFTFSDISHDSSNPGDCNYDTAGAMIHSVWPYYTHSESTVDGTLTSQDVDFIAETGQPRKVTANGNGVTQVKYTTYEWEYTDPLSVAMKAKNMLSYPRYSAVGSSSAGFPIATPLDFTTWTNIYGASKSTYQEYPASSGNYYPYQSYVWEDSGTINHQIAATEFKLQSQVNSVDIWGRATEVQDINGIKTKTYFGNNDACDNTGNDLKHAYPTCQEQCKDASCSSSFTTKSSYGPMGNVIQQTDPNSAVKKYTYDKLWRLKKVFNPGDTPFSDADDEGCGTVGFSVCYVYRYAWTDGTGLTYTPSDLTTMDMNMVTTSQRIDDAPQYMRSSTLADGIGRDWITNTTDTANNKIVTVKTYNAVGLVETQSEPTKLGDVAVTSRTEYEASPLFRPVKVYPLGQYGLSPEVSITTANSGDANFHYTTMTDEKGIQSRSKTDKLGRTVEVIADFAGTPITTSTVYNDIAGQSITVTNPSSQVTETRSDSLGRVRVTQHPDFGVRRNLKYDNKNNLLISGDGCCPKTGCPALTTVNDFSNTDPAFYQCTRLVGYAYDNLNRLLCVKYNAASTWDGSSCTGADVTNYYDVATADCTDTTFNNPKGRLTEVVSTYSGSFKACYYYDARGQLRKEQRFIDGTAVGTSPLEYTYDNAGNLVTLTYPNGDHADYYYNKLNQLWQVYLNNDKLSEYAYYPDGLVQTQTYVNKCVA